MFKQYGVPLLIPAMIALCISPFIAPDPTASLDRIPSFDAIKSYLPFSGPPRTTPAVTDEIELDDAGRFDAFEPAVEPIGYEEDPPTITNEITLDDDDDEEEDDEEAVERRSVRDHKRMTRRRRRRV